MGIKTPVENVDVFFSSPLKNLPTTWGLRLHLHVIAKWHLPLKNLPTTWGLRLLT